MNILSLQTQINLSKLLFYYGWIKCIVNRTSVQQTATPVSVHVPLGPQSLSETCTASPAIARSPLIQLGGLEQCLDQGDKGNSWASNLQPQTIRVLHIVFAHMYVLKGPCKPGGLT